jgi:hypothetical protein
MPHPLGKNLDQLSTSEIEKQLNDLRLKYFKTTNPEIRNQINFFITDYSEELKMRWYKEQQELSKSSGKDVDDLINID